MTSNQMDRICNGEEVQEAINRLEANTKQNVNINSSLKRHATSEHDQFALNLTRTFTNSSHHREKQQLSNTNNNNRNGCKINNNNIKVSNYALNYAADYQYPPFKLECEPKLDDKKEGVKLKERYPDELINIKSNPIPPTHLPRQHTIILKWIKNTITDQDIKNELCINYKSIRSISTINDTLNERTRHVTIEFLDKKDYDTLLNSKKINLMGQLYDINEFLPAPKILICRRCNQPGHTKKVCLNSSFDICHCCGGNRTNIEEHKECPIKCHHCQAEHLSTDYKCPLIDDYRRQIICELRKHPEKLPQHIQLFIPPEYRNQNNKEKIIQNKTMYHLTQQQYYCRNDHNQWALLTSTTTTNTTTNQNMNEIIKSFNDELVELKKKYKEDQQRNEEK
ncbi:unnamed protein product [Rotaria sp. Silwood2]|nr:unnamed protein product [Rotaria sp. Silwood2]CAF3197557.1 unnamed protein product [Rotaria sp. Silwood2]CAF3426337.1 unnamed protein product [Rotaria sp. Silwood2]CAF4494289.1 unnamed protein product [Rotaria sp. Silwood2]CAF4576244.1 unnamed protein product [Rotaria sp. Silwood2]